MNLRAIMIMIALPMLVHGQGNLVPNGSFEFFTDCPTSINQYHLAQPWTNTGFQNCSPDYYNSCNPPLFYPPDLYIPHLGVPENGTDYQYAHDGEAYMGFFAYVNYQLNGREYVQVELTEPLVAEREYVVTFHVSLADKYRYAVGSFGAYFSWQQVVRENGDYLNVTPQIQSPPGFLFDDKENWMMVRDTFSSRFGGERFLTIGNFNTDAESDTVLLETGLDNKRQAYYYLDDVSVIALDSIPDNIAEQEQLNFDVWPNPASEVLHIQSRLPFARLRLLDISGRAVLSENITADRHTLQLAGIPPGLYLLEATDTEGRRAVMKVIVQ